MTETHALFVLCFANCGSGVLLPFCHDLQFWKAFSLEWIMEVFQEVSFSLCCDFCFDLLRFKLISELFVEQDHNHVLQFFDTQ